MSMVVKNNIPAVYGLGTLNRNSTALSKSLEKVSTGMKINSAADDNSAWSISERMRVRIRGLDQADQNTQNGRSLLKVAEGAVQSTVDILKTLKEKAINAANDTNTDADRQTIQKELNQSIDQIDDNANVTYNGKYLVDGSKTTAGSATYTSMTNQSLSEDTVAVTRLVDLKSRAGDSLHILTTDKLSISFVRGGKTYATTMNVTSDMKLTDLAKYANLAFAKGQGGSVYSTVTGAYTQYDSDVNTAEGNYQSALQSMNNVIAAANGNAAIIATAMQQIAQAADTLAGDLEAAANTLNTSIENVAAFSGMVTSTSMIGTGANGLDVYTVDGTNGITFKAMGSGISNQIAGFALSVTDSEGQVKKTVNAALDAFSESLRAVNQSEDDALTLHVGADPGVAIKLGLTDMRSEALGLKGADGTKLDISTQERANAAISVLDNAIQKALNQQADIGNIASRLEYTSANLRVASDNVQASESTIRDADMAKEMTAYTKNNVLLSASQSMLSQANQNSMNVMTLLQ